MVEALVLVAGAAAGGAILNTLRGYLHNTEGGYSAKKLGGSLIIAVLGLQNDTTEKFIRETKFLTSSWWDLAVFTRRLGI